MQQPTKLHTSSKIKAKHITQNIHQNGWNEKCICRYPHARAKAVGPIDRQQTPSRSRPTCCLCRRALVLRAPGVLSFEAAVKPVGMASDFFESTSQKRYFRHYDHLKEKLYCLPFTGVRFLQNVANGLSKIVEDFELVVALPLKQNLDCFFLLLDQKLVRILKHIHAQKKASFDGIISWSSWTDRVLTETEKWGFFNDPLVENNFWTKTDRREEQPLDVSGPPQCGVLTKLMNAER